MPLHMVQVGDGAKIAVSEVWHRLVQQCGKVSAVTQPPSGWGSFRHIPVLPVLLLQSFSFSPTTMTLALQDSRLLEVDSVYMLSVCSSSVVV